MKDLIRLTVMSAAFGALLAAAVVISHLGFPVADRTRSAKDYPECCCGPSCNCCIDCPCADVKAKRGDQ